MHGERDEIVPPAWGRAVAQIRGAPPRYVRQPAGSAVDEFEPLIREQLLAVPTMPATVIAERVGWTRGMTVLKERVRELMKPCGALRQGSASRCRWSLSGQ